MERNAFIRALDDRITQFSGKVIAIANGLPKSGVGRTICDQLTRSGFSVVLNFSEARSAESRKDFIHKIGISLKELREVYAILRMLPSTFPNHDNSRLTETTQEADELISILVTSLNTAKTNTK